MNCCTECFCDLPIRTMIEAGGKKGKCDFCGKSDVFVCSLDQQSDLSDLISDIVNVYEPCEEGNPLIEILVNDWHIFDKTLPSAASLANAFCNLAYGERAGDDNVSVRIPPTVSEAYGIFSGHSWAEFSSSVKTKNRFYNSFFQAKKFESFLTYSISKYQKGTAFYRARICNDIHGYETDAMGIPPFNKRKSGRVNPEGISVLYLTSDEKTALNEVRASAFDYVCIGTFRLKEDVTVVNLPALNCISPALYSDAIDSLAANIKVFSDIAREVAKPLRRNDSPLEYLPTQYITEFIKSVGYAGVEYMSTMGTGGHNIALFDEAVCECQAVHTVEIKALQYSYE